MDPRSIEFIASLSCGLLLTLFFFLARHNYEVNARSLILTVTGNLCLIASQVAVMVTLYTLHYRLYFHIASLVLFACGTTLYYWKYMRIKIKTFKLDPYLFEPSNNKIEYKGYFVRQLWKKLLAYFLIQCCVVVEIFIYPKYSFGRGILWIMFGCMSVLVLFQVRSARAKDRIKIRRELLELFVFGLIFGMIVIADSYFTIVYKYSISDFLLSIGVPISLFIATYNGILAAFQNVRLEKSIENNFEGFSYVLTNQVLFTVITIYIDV